MKLVIDIDDKDIPKRQDAMDIHILFIDGEVCDCDYPFIELSKGHGRLIDADVLTDGFEDNYEFCEAVNATPTVIEADSEVEE